MILRLESEHRSIGRTAAPMVINTLKWTIHDLAAMPDDGGWKRYELINGELLVTRAPHIRHQGASGNIHVELELWSRQTQRGRSFQSPGVIFSPNDAVIPDVAWISHERLVNGCDESGHLTVAPELMVEVLSLGDLNEQRDKDVKRKLYSIYGVQEYWIVNWRLKTLEVYRRHESQLRLDATLLEGDLLTSELLPQFKLEVRQIFL